MLGQELGITSCIQGQADGDVLAIPQGLARWLGGLGKVADDLTVLSGGRV